MATPSIVPRGRYELYKSRTSLFIQLLTDTASQVCDLETVVAALRDRKDTRRPQQSSRRPHQSHEKITLTTREIITLTNIVAEDDKAQVPGRMLSLLRSVIYQRKRVAATYAASPAERGSDRERSNVTHLYFADSRIIAPASPAAPSEVKPLTNLFEHLDVDEPVDILSGNSEADQPVLNAPRFNFRVDVAEKEKQMVKLRCLLSDLHQASLYAEETWKDHALGQNSTVLAGIVADVAFGVMRRTFEDFAAKHPEFKNYGSVLKFFGLRMETTDRFTIVLPSSTSHQTTQLSVAPGSDNPFIASKEGGLLQQPQEMDSHTAQIMCTSGAAIMQDLHQLINSPLRSPDAYASKPYRHDFVKALVAALPELQACSQQPRARNPEAGEWWGDEFVSALLNYAHGKLEDLPLWLPIAAQCYRNIYDIVGGNMMCGAQAFVEGTTRTLAMVESFENFAYVEGEGDPIGAKATVHDHTRDARQRDGVENWVLRKQGKTVAPLPEPCMPLNITGTLPTVACGMLLEHAFQTAFFSHGVVNTHGIVHSAVALYLACRKWGIIKDDSEWEDMVFFLGHYDLLSEAAHSADRYAMVSRFHRMLGIPLRSLADLKRDPTLPGHSTIQENYRLITWDSSLVNQHFDGIRNMYGSGRDVASNALVDVMLRRLAAGGKFGRSEQVQYSPIELLTTFKKNLADAELLFNFNAVSFHQKCSTFLSVARDRVSSAFPTMSNLPTMRVHYFTNAVLVESARIMSLEKPAAYTLLPIVAAALQSVIQGCSGEFSSESLARSSGSLAADRKPAVFRATSCADRCFEVFLRDCVGEGRGLLFEDSSNGTAICSRDGKIDHLNRLEQMAGIFQRVVSIDQHVAIFANLELEMKAWAASYFKKKAMPWSLVGVIGVSLRHDQNQSWLQSRT